jgi:hypothetical protein
VYVWRVTRDGESDPTGRRVAETENDEGTGVKWLARLYCWVFFHELIVVHRCSEQAQKVACLRCGAEFGIHFGVEAFVPWNDGLCICRVYELQGLTLFGDPIYRELPANYADIDGLGLPVDPEYGKPVGNPLGKELDR